MPQEARLPGLALIACYAAKNARAAFLETCARKTEY